MNFQDATKVHIYQICSTQIKHSISFLFETLFKKNRPLIS
jgi:hypothetical protein